MLPSSDNVTAEVVRALWLCHLRGTDQIPGRKEKSKKSQAAAVFSRSQWAQGTEAVRKEHGHIGGVRHEGQFKLGLDRWVFLSF